MEYGPRRDHMGEPESRISGLNPASRTSPSQKPLFVICPSQWAKVLKSLKGWILHPTSIIRLGFNIQEQNHIQIIANSFSILQGDGSEAWVSVDLSSTCSQLCPLRNIHLLGFLPSPIQLSHSLTHDSWTLPNKWFASKSLLQRSLWEEDSLTHVSGHIASIADEAKCKKQVHQPKTGTL